MHESGAVYACEERAVATPGGGRSWEVRFARFADAEDFVQTVVASPWWEATFPGAPWQVVVERRSRSATWSAAGVTPDSPGVAGTPGVLGVVWLVDRHGWDRTTVLHELAHLAAGTGAGHGPRFRTALLALWREWVGVEAWVALDAEFAATFGCGAAAES